jgi:hypothetical protein
MGAQAKARNATRVNAQFTPRFLNIGSTNSGKLEWAITVSALYSLLPRKGV